MVNMTFKKKEKVYNNNEVRSIFVSIDGFVRAQLTTPHFR